MKFALSKSLLIAAKQQIPNLKKFGISSTFLFSFLLSAGEFSFFQKDPNGWKNFSDTDFSHAYERFPDSEIKSFSYPPVKLQDPKLEIEELKTDLCFFKILLKGESCMLPLSRKANKVHFITKFFPSIYKSSPLAQVGILRIDHSPTPPQLEFTTESSLTYSLSSVAPELKELFLEKPLSAYTLTQDFQNNDYEYIEVESLLIPRYRCAISNHFSLKKLEITSSSIAKTLKSSAKFHQSLKKESSSVYVNPLPQVALALNCEDPVAKFYNPLSELDARSKIYLTSIREIEFEKTTMPSSFAVEMIRPLQSAIGVTHPVQKKLSPSEILVGLSFSKKVTGSIIHIQVKEPSLPRSHLSNTYLKESFPSISKPLFEAKESLTFISTLTPPSPPIRLAKNISSPQKTKIEPKKSLHTQVTYAVAQPMIDLETKQETYSFFPLKNSVCSLIPIPSVDSEKPLLLGSNCFWRPSHSEKILTLKKQESPHPYYTFKKEETKPIAKIPSKPLLLSLTNDMSSYKNSYFKCDKTFLIISFISPATPIFKNHLSFTNFSKQAIDTLVKLYPSDKQPSRKTLFNYHDAIVKVLNQPEKFGEYAPTTKFATNVKLPEKVVHQISLPNSPVFSDEKIEGAITRLKSKTPAKQGIFPQKRFLESVTLLCETDVLNAPETSFTYSSIQADLSDYLIPTEKVLISSNLITTPSLEKTFSPNLYPDDVNILLKTIKEISAYTFILQDALSINRNNRQIFHNISDMPSLEELQTYSLSDDFKIDVHVLQKPDRSGYAFSLQLSPYNHECIEPIKNHIYFILDRSSSIESHRFSSFKNGIMQSLAQLHESSSFNIFTFDQNYDKLSEDDLRPSKSSISYAKKQLDRVSQKWSSSFVTLLTLLNEIKKEAEKTDEPYTVIILSNGQFLKNLRFNKDALLQLFHQNNSNFSIYTAAISDNNNTYMLDLLAKLGRGEFLYSQTHSAFPRKLAVMTKRLQRPLACDISVSLATSNEKISFSHFSQTAPLLFADKLYHIYGQTETLQDLHLVIQGKSGEKWINIVKKIDLKKAEKNKEIAKELSSKEALAHIMNYIFTSDQSELAAAKALIAPFDIKWSL